MKYFIIALLLIINANVLLGHDPSMISGITAGANFYKSDIGVGIAPDIEATFWLVNAGTNFYYQGNLKPTYSLYVGVGLMNLIQVQYGTNFSENMLRIRTILPILNDNPILWEGIWDEEWHKRFNLQLEYEKNYQDPRKTHFAIGVSYLFTKIIYRD